MRRDFRWRYTGPPSSLLRTHYILTKEGLVKAAVFVAPHAKAVVKLKTIVIPLVSRTTPIPVGESESLSSDPLPAAFAVPIIGAEPEAFGLFAAAESLANVALDLHRRDRRQRALGSFTYALGRHPVHLFRVVFVVNIANGGRRRHWGGGGFSASSGRFRGSSRNILNDLHRHGLNDGHVLDDFLNDGHFLGNVLDDGHVLDDFLDDGLDDGRRRDG